MKRQRQAARFAMAALLAAATACATPDGGPEGGRELPDDARALVAVWITDVEATLDRAAAAWHAARGAPPGPAELQRLRDGLARLDTQLGLNNDGTFILVNRAADAVGTITVEGRWEHDDGGVRLTGLRERGQPATPQKTVVYRVDGERLVRESGAPPEVYPVLKKGLVP
ncbi:MAG: hypothetical protein JXQ29_08530 [Planctomycetes bacterium]|nr:hypothetical protein [Planctomycetota bacterium]